MSMSEKIVNFDFEGWPEKAMSIKDILKSFGATYNEETKKWEIPDSEHLDEIPTVLEDDGSGYGVNEKYLITGNFYKHNDGPEGFRFFEDVELDYSNIWVDAGVHPGQIINVDGKEWMLAEVTESEDGHEFMCLEYDIEKLKNRTANKCAFTVEQVKKMIE